MPDSGNTTSDPESTQTGGVDDAAPKVVPAFTLLWCIDESHRVGETALFHGSGRSFIGRDGGELDSAVFVRLRPGVVERTGALASTIVSRRQLQVDVGGDEIEIENVGNLALLVNGKETKRARLEPGDLVELVVARKDGRPPRKHVGMMFSMRPAAIPRMALYGAHEFGEPDRFGIVGESAAIWELRERIAFVAQFDEHVLVFGETGTGKELAASAIHALSPRARGPFVDRNAATVPDALVEAEVFGNRKDYPNPGMPESDGLVGAARGGTLFLDEIGELPHGAQAAFLRVFDPGASYQRLGDPKARKADVRFVAATNREPRELKKDFAPRFHHRVEIPPLDARREDIPLLARALMLQAAAKSAQAMAPYIDRTGPRAEVKLDPTLVAHLVTRDYPGNLRDLGNVLRAAMAASRDGVLRTTPEMLAPAPLPPAPRAPPPAKDDVRLALAQNDGNATHAAESLGISRHSLRRLMKKYGMRAAA